ncbi:MAG: peptidylprolyl isomerase [Croceibacterium sp.]
MKKLCALALILAAPAVAQDTPEPATPASIVAAAPAADWTAIDPADLLVMTLAPDRDGNPRQVVIQLMPAPFSQGWVSNIRTLAKAHWWDGTSVYRVVDNWVAQWGDVEETKAMPEGLKVVPESDYVAPITDQMENSVLGALTDAFEAYTENRYYWKSGESSEFPRSGPYSDIEIWANGWPLATNEDAASIWPTHCYASVGVARDTETTGTGAELYAVIGHAPRQLDRNIAVVGRVIEGIDNLSTLPRGKGDAGVYDDAKLRVPIVSVRLGDELPAAEQPHFEYLGSETKSFADYVQIRANRHDAFYKVPAGGIDVCNVQVPIRQVAHG